MCEKVLSVMERNRPEGDGEAAVRWSGGMAGKVAFEQRLVEGQSRLTLGGTIVGFTQLTSGEGPEGPPHSSLVHPANSRQRPRSVLLCRP